MYSISSKSSVPKHATNCNNKCICSPLKLTKAKQLAIQNVITYGSDGPGPGETTSGTFGASVNDASTFSSKKRRTLCYW